MTSQGDFVQPPRIASWLLALFATGKEGASISGDLLEEFSTLGLQSGIYSARRWYRRQVFLTVLHLTGGAFRTAPWLIALVLAGLWAIGFATRFSGHAIQAFLDAHRYYDLHPDAYLFWLKFPFEAGRAILCVLIGGMVALVAKQREMPAVVSLTLAQILLYLTGAVALVVTGRGWLQWLLAMMFWNGLCCLSTLAGGAIVSTRRARFESRSATVPFD